MQSLAFFGSLLCSASYQFCYVRDGPLGVPHLALVSGVLVAGVHLQAVPLGVATSVSTCLINVACWLSFV